MLSWPAYTILATSSAASSVTRRPATIRGSWPSRRLSAEACGPPPWTTTSRMPSDESSASCVGDLVEHLGVAQHVAAELHDEDLVAVGADVAERALEAGDALGGSIVTVPSVSGEQ